MYCSIVTQGEVVYGNDNYSFLQNRMVNATIFERTNDKWIGWWFERFSVCCDKVKCQKENEDVSNAPTSFGISCSISRI